MGTGAFPGKAGPLAPGPLFMVDFCMNVASGARVVCTNRKARHQYHILETLEAGLVLQGTEVKSLREGRANLADSYVLIEGGEAYLHHCHVSPYSHGTHANHEPLRRRKLLLHREEIRRLAGKVKERGLTLIPLQIHFVRGRAKILIALAKGKRLHDKREDLRRRAAQREVEQAFRMRQRAR